MPALTRPDATVNYEVWGPDAPGRSPRWMTLINGHTRPLTDFRMLGRHLVAAGLRVLALDNRGAGKTVAPGEFTLADMVGDVVALWDALDVGSGGLVGVSMGGFIATTLAGVYPARVRRLVLVSTAARQHHVRRDDTPWTEDLASVAAKLRPYFAGEFAQRNEALIRGMAKQIAQAVAAGSFQRQSERQKRAVAGYDGAALAKRIVAPTLIIHGEADEVVPKAAGEELCGLIAGSRLELVRDAGHLLLAEKPRELYAAVAAWLGG